MRLVTGTVLAALVVGIGVVALAAPEQTTLQPGEKAPAFELFGVDYRYHSLEQYKDGKAVAVIFTCNHCPVAQGYEDKLIEIAKAYQPRGIRFIAVNPNAADMQPQDGFPQMIERAKQKEFPYPYVYDETQKTARAYGATVTPHVFVVGPDGTVLYEGAVDNRHSAPDYFTDALESILKGEKVAKASTSEFGCSVKYRPAPRAAATTPAG